MTAIDGTLELEAYRLIGRFMGAALRQHRMPSGDLLHGMDADDLVQDIYLDIRPALGRFDRKRGALSTFIYRRVMDRAHRFGWRATRGGIRMPRGRFKIPAVSFTEFPTTDCHTDHELIEHATIWSDPGAQSHELHRFLAYDDPPEGLEIPGTDEVL